jgi:hypothetical protein
MGRGSSYPHNHFMLFDNDSDDFMRYPELEDEHGNGTGEYNYTGEPIFDEMLYEDFKCEVAVAFGTEKESRPIRWLDPEMHIFAETDRLKIGVDWSGGLPCIFALPKNYVPWNSYDSCNEKEYNIDRDVEKAFSKLIKIYNGKGKRLFKNPLFRYPTSGYTSSPYTLGKYIA